MALELLSDDQEAEIADTALDNILGPGDPEVFYTLRPIPLTLNRQTRKKHTKVTRPNGIREEVFDDAGFFDDLIDYALVGWRGINIKGQPADCTRENKIRGLDGARKNALLALAGINRPMQAQAQRDSSFRSPA